jgi:diacylglycerol kinase (ATP)
VNNEVKKVLFIVNKFAGAGFRAELEAGIRESCGFHRVESDIVFTEARGHATELSRDAARNSSFQFVVAVGGDGTVNEVAQGLLHTDTPLGIIPKGSGNGLARHLRIPMQLSRALPTLFSSQVISMDTFKMNGMLSLNVSGIGFDGHIANLFGQSKKRGLQGYAKHALNEFIRFPEFEAEIETSHKTFVRKAFVIAIANASQYGNNARIAPAASIRDEMLHINILKKVPPYRLDFIYAFFTGNINRYAYCEFLETRKITIRLKEPIAFHIDGEASGKAREFQIEVLPASLKILVPKQTLNP